MIREGKVVCVTGASGFVASWLVKLLLERGYTVKATVRDRSDPKKMEHLLALDGAKERLHLFNAGLLNDGCFDSVVDGCAGVFHTASPVLAASSITNPKTQLFDPAVKGTLNVLKSCTRVPSIKRVVMTSSLAAVLYNGKPLTPEVEVDETWFSDPTFCENTKLWYMLSKTLAEEAAWKFANENGIDLVTLNPGFVIGPILQPTLNATNEVILNLLKGKRPLPFDKLVGVDVRDVAYGHIQAFENPTANGRYCLVGRVSHIYETLKIVNELYPSLHLNEKYGDKPVEAVYQVSKEKAKSLGVNFIHLEVSLKDTVESFKEKGFL